MVLHNDTFKTENIHRHPCEHTQHVNRISIKNALHKCFFSLQN